MRDHATLTDQLWSRILILQSRNLITERIIKDKLGLTDADILQYAEQEGRAVEHDLQGETTPEPASSTASERVPPDEPVGALAAQSPADSPGRPA